MNLDKVEKTWKDVESVWSHKFSGESRKQFLEKQLSEARLSKLREFVTSDLEETKENRARVDRLFEQFEKAKEKLQKNGKKEIENLNEFFWTEEKPEQIVVCLDNFQVVSDNKCNEVADLIGQQRYCSYYEVKRGEIHSSITTMDSEHLLTFYNKNDIVFWMLRHAEEISVKSEFQRGVYASLIERASAGNLNFPLSFYAYGSLWKKGEERVFRSTTGDTFVSKLKEREQKIQTEAGEVTVVTFE